jgi:hypothetical protein
MSQLAGRGGAYLGSVLPQTRQACAERGSASRSDVPVDKTPRFYWTYFGFSTLLRVADPRSDVEAARQL